MYGQKKLTKLYNDYLRTINVIRYKYGAFQNPPKHIAQLFHEVIATKYKKSFKYIVFAIINDHNAMKAHNPTGNIQPFAEVFQINICIRMSSAFVELLRKSNLDYIVTRKSLKVGSHSDDIIFASLIDTKTKTLQLIACLDKLESVTIWSTALDERAFQLNARLLDITELGETMIFLSERINESDFTLAKASKTNSDSQYEVSQINVTFTHPKNKQSITLQLYENINDGEKASFLSKILLHIYKRNEQLSAEIKTQQLRLKELSSKTEREQLRSSGTNRIFDDNKLLDSNTQKINMMKSQEHTPKSLINPTIKRRKAATGVNYDDEDSD
ncbi:unnamed protein product [Rotaria sordida]|uniref:Uncharacterized protein n=2 Tax=Rotaria sordida TaxID=392033 RepID=A0A813YBU2_9BILA|nr:unnamed protein product [Rotaria sordida]